jgi:Protein of unknown function (DUF2934)
LTSNLSTSELGVSDSSHFGPFQKFHFPSALGFYPDALAHYLRIGQCTNPAPLTDLSRERRFAKKGKEVDSMSKDPEKKSTRATESQGENAEEQIRERAYELYEARGRQDGHELDDWQQAEKEIMGVRRKSIAA